MASLHFITGSIQDWKVSLPKPYQEVQTQVRQLEALLKPLEKKEYLLEKFEKEFHKICQLVSVLLIIFFG